MPDITIPEPTSSHILWGGAVEIHCFGRPQNWSLAGGSGLEAEMNNPGIRYRMLRLAEKYGCEKIYAPNPSEFNAQIVTPDDFPVSWTDTPVLRGPFADGVLLTEANTAFAVSSADCPTSLLCDSSTGNVVATHAGLKSLLSGTPQTDDLVMNMFLSVVAASPHPLDPESLRGFIACGIGAHFYILDPEHAAFTEEHRLLLEKIMKTFPAHAIPKGRGGLSGPYGIDLRGIFDENMGYIPVGRDCVGFDGVCTFSGKDTNGNPLWHSNRRGDKTRNLVLVIRR